MERKSLFLTDNYSHRSKRWLSAKGQWKVFPVSGEYPTSNGMWKLAPNAAQP
jgi:hypothetical protein